MTVHHPQRSIFFFFYIITPGVGGHFVRGTRFPRAYEQEFLSIIFYNLERSNDLGIRLSEDFVLFSDDTDVSPVIPNTNNSQRHTGNYFFPRSSVFPSVNITSNWIRNNIHLNMQFIVPNN